MLTSGSVRPGAGIAGFSLIELMVTLALLAFLLLLGLPAFTAMVKNTQVRTVADALQNGLRIARAEALRTNQQTVFALTNATPALNNVTPAANGINWWVQTIPHAGGDTASAVQNGSGALTDVASGVSITGPAVICFSSNGRLTDLGGASPGLGSATCSASQAYYSYTISQTKADLNLQVQVRVGGQVRLCDTRRPFSATAPDGC